MISEEAIEAAAEWLPHSDDCEVRPARDCTCWHPRLALMRATLEAAAPILLSHERQLAADAHRDAIVNRDTADRLERELETAKAEAWDEGWGAGAGWPQEDRNPYRSQS